MESRSLAFVPHHLKTEGMCNKVERRDPYNLKIVSDHLKTQEMCNEAMRNNPATLFLIPDHFKTQKLCDKAIEIDPWQLNDVPDCLTMQDMCDKVVRDDAFSLVCVPDWFLMQEEVKIWHDTDDWYEDGEIIEWYKRHKKCKAQKAKIKEELLPIAWHPDRVMDWCMSADEKRQLK